MTLSDGEIKRHLARGGLKIEPLEDPNTQIQPCSVDLRLSEDIYLGPGAFALASTIETVTIPKTMVGRLCGRSSVGRTGVQVENAGLVDPGFHGQLTLELVNFARVGAELRKGMRICQITFEQMMFPAERPYGHESRRSKYQGQSGPTPSRLEEDA